jgi:hypothetical protein
MHESEKDIPVGFGCSICGTPSPQESHGSKSHEAAEGHLSNGQYCRNRKLNKMQHHEHIDTAQHGHQEMTRPGSEEGMHESEKDIP